MSYKEHRAELVRREKQLQVAFIESHKRGDVKKKADVLKHIDINTHRFRALGPKR